MILSSNCWLNLNWIDPKLRWDPSLFSNIKHSHIPFERVWRPDIMLSDRFFQFFINKYVLLIDKNL
jgi:hypothetical protein